MHGVKHFLVSTKTKFQRIDIVECHRYGKCLFLDGKIQSSEADEFIYHEVLVHPALLLPSSLKKVLIIGGGEGATLREVLKHPSLEYILMVDIDQELIKYCQQFLPEWSRGAFEDSRVELIFEDARKHLEETKEIFNSMIIDLPEPLEGGPAWRLYTREFYKLVFEHLSEDGTIALQAGTTRFRDTELLVSIVKTLQTIFPVVRPFQAIIPSFDLPWGFVLATKKTDPLNLSPAEIDKRLEERKIDTLGYYDGLMHQAIFILPKYLRRDLKERGRVIEDETPFFLSV